MIYDEKAVLKVDGVTENDFGEQVPDLQVIDTFNVKTAPVSFEEVKLFELSVNKQAVKVFCQNKLFYYDELGKKRTNVFFEHNQVVYRAIGGKDLKKVFMLIGESL